MTLTPLMAGKTPAFFVEGITGDEGTQHFVDESGDFGDYAEHSSYYIISLIMHIFRVSIS